MEWREFSRLRCRPGRSVDAPPWESGNGQAESYSEEMIRAANGRITRACLCMGLSLADSEEIAQEIWIWVLRLGVPTALMTTPWLKAVVHNHVLRHRRRSYSRAVREGRTLESVPEPRVWQPFARLEAKDLLDRVASLLPERERDLLALIRRGYSLPEASRRLGIPDGSRAYYQGRLIDYARRVLKRPGAATLKRSQPGNRTSRSSRAGRRSGSFSGNRADDDDNASLF